MVKEAEVVPGIIKGLDPQRRLVIPKEVLRAAGFEPGDLLQVWSDVTDDGVPCLYLTKYSPGCVICGTTECLVKFSNGKRLCRKCAREALSEPGGEEKPV